MHHKLNCKTTNANKLTAGKRGVITRTLLHQLVAFMTAAILILSEGERKLNVNFSFAWFLFIFSWYGCLVDVRCKKEILSKESYINYVVADRGWGGG